MINVLSDGGTAERDTDLTQVRGPRGEVTPLLLPSLVLLRWRKSPRAIRGYRVYEFYNGEAQAAASLEEANLTSGGWREDVT